MSLFFISNIIISLVAIAYFRYFRASIAAKLWFSTFAGICWVVPFTLIRTYLPQKIAVEIEWLPAIKMAVTNQAVADQSTIYWNYLTPVNLLLFASAFGLIIFASRLFNYFQWHKKIKTEKYTKLLGYTNDVAYYSSPSINHAVLIGYSKPTIWLNPKLAHSKYLDVLLAHELTHAKHKDNYWLLILEFFSSIYWWNPLFKLLSQQIKDGLESRCDFHTSHSFPKDGYLEKLTDLVLLSTHDFNHKFANAITSKNSSIHRLKLLTEKQTMTILSKLIISSVFTSCIALLIFPVSSIGAISSTEPSHLVSIAPDAMGVRLELNIEMTMTTDGNKKQSNSQMTLWNKSGDKATVKIDPQLEIELTAKIAPDDRILIESKVYQIKSDQSRKLKASPRVFTKNGMPAFIEMGDDDTSSWLSSFSMKILPNKTKYSELKP